MPGSIDRAASSTGTPSAALLRLQQSRSFQPPANFGTGNSGDDDDDNKKKYVKRNSGFVRKLQRIFPSLMGQGLPVTTK